MLPLGETSKSALPAILSAGTVAAVGAAVLATVDAATLSFLMALHLAIMNVAAPLAAAIFFVRVPDAARRPALLWLAGIAQMLLLWSWHLPATQQAAADSPHLHVVMLVLLAIAALLFWMLLLDAGTRGRWNAVAVLLLTGKLACLLGALLIFASRDLYGLPGHEFAICSIGPSTLADQQLAGLLMITACPLSYVVAGIVLATQMIARLERSSAPRPKQDVMAPG